MRGFSAHVNDHCCCQLSPSSQSHPSNRHANSCCHCVLSPPLLHHLTIASALVAKMRTKSTTRIVSHFCVRLCLLFTVRAHVQPPLLKIREEKSARRCSHRTFVEYLSPLPLLHHTLCSNDTKIQNMNIGCTVGPLRTYHTTHIL